MYVVRRWLTEQPKHVANLSIYRDKSANIFVVVVVFVGKLSEEEKCTRFVNLSSSSLMIQILVLTFTSQVFCYDIFDYCCVGFVWK
jgi:hypothetical protein